MTQTQPELHQPHTKITTPFSNQPEATLPLVAESHVDSSTQNPNPISNTDPDPYGHCKKVYKISLAVKWVIQAEYVGFIAADSLGYFAQECIDFTIIPGGPGIDSLKYVRAGLAQLYISSFATVFSAREQGLNLTAVWQTNSRSGLRGVTMKSSGLDSWEKLKGKTLGYWNQDQLPFIATLREHGINETTEVHLMPQSFSPVPLVQPNAFFDFMLMYSHNELLQLLELKKKNSDRLWELSDFNVFSLSSDDILPFDNVILVHEEWLNSNVTEEGEVSNRDVMPLFLKASMKGWIYCRDHEAQCLTTLPERNLHQSLQIREVNRLVWPSGPLGIGVMNMSQVNRVIENSVENGFISSDIYNLPIDNYCTNVFALRAIVALQEEMNIDLQKSFLFGNMTGIGYNQGPICIQLDSTSGKAVLCVSEKNITLIVCLAVILAAFICIVFLSIALLLCWRVRVHKVKKVNVLAPTGGNFTILFTDIQDSTILWNKDQDAMKSSLDKHNRLLRSLLKELHGFEIKTQGDSFMCAFKDPMDALLWMLRVQEDLLQVNWPNSLLNHGCSKFEVDEGGEMIYRGLRVRIGAHYGSPTPQMDRTTMRYDYHGNDVNLAARITNAAYGGQILVSEQFLNQVKDGMQIIRDPVGHAVAVKKLGYYQLKGIGSPCNIFQLLPHALRNRTFPVPMRDKSEPKPNPEPLIGQPNVTVSSVSPCVNIELDEVASLQCTEHEAEVLSPIRDTSELPLLTDPLGPTLFFSRRHSAPCASYPPSNIVETCKKFTKENWLSILRVSRNQKDEQETRIKNHQTANYSSNHCLVTPAVSSPIAPEV